jgi:5-formyltetrahydrofolate cyclo-ligase
MNNKIAKSELRQRIRLERNRLPESEILAAGQSLSSQLDTHNIIQPRKKIACFLSFDGEISTQSTLRLIGKLGARCYLPKLRPHKPNRLWFMPYQQTTSMTNNRYGIAEVDLPINKAIAVSKLDVILVPLVGFDLQGNRLGMGGGFYDATFNHLRNKENRPLFIGLAYDMQKFENLPSDSWDLPLDGVCTEKNFYRFGTKKPS